MSYLHDDVFLTSNIAKELYHKVAAKAPIIDFHTHLDEESILNNHKFANLWELWLKEDHYKWRLMRACGVREDLITGSANPWEKFEAFAKIMPLAVGNPVHHWAHLELKRLFDIDLLLNAANARKIWDEANSQLGSNAKLRVQGLLEKFKVELVCTTDDPCSDLLVHSQINQDKGSSTKVYPTFRPDQAMNVKNPVEFNAWVAKLSSISEHAINSFTTFITALKARHDYFDSQGCRLSDHGLAYSPYREVSLGELEIIFSKVEQGVAATEEEWQAFAFSVLKHIAQWNYVAKWSMQLHLGPLRSVNTNMLAITGKDSGFDTMGDYRQTASLIKLLDSFSKANILGKTIVYNLNPMESESICCALQNFQNDQAQGLIQYGPAWWHLDNVRGIREQIDILSALSAIGTSVGMLTDSRSFTSYVRHEYYRRLLCQYIGDAAEAGEIPNDKELLDSLIYNICYGNAKHYFNWENEFHVK